MSLFKEPKVCIDSLWKKKRLFGIYLSKFESTACHSFNARSTTMFRNVTGAQEAVVHTYSVDSLTRESTSDRIKSIKDIQADDVAQNYATVKEKWLNERAQLVKKLKNLEKRKAFPHEILHTKALIECMNELIDNGELSSNCQKLINERKNAIVPLPDTFTLTKKPLGDKSISLPRHISKTSVHLQTNSCLRRPIVQQKHIFDDMDEETTAQQSNSIKAWTRAFNSTL